MLEQNDEVNAEYMIFNSTDGVLFDPRTFHTVDEATVAAEEHRAAYTRQGYYLTADGLRIDPADIELEIAAVKE